MKARAALILVLIALLATACQPSTPTPEAAACGITAPAADEAEDLPFEGVWIDSAGNIFAVSGLDVYLRTLDGAKVTEQKGEIVLYDVDANTLQVSFKSFCVDGEDVAIELATANIRYQVNGDRLQYAIQATDYPAEVGAAVFEKKLK